MSKDKRKRGLPRGRRLSYGLCAAVAVLVLLCPVNGVKAQSDKLGPAVRYDVLKYKLDQAVRAKNHEQTIALIKRLRGTRLGISGEIPFYEGRAHSELNNWTGAYRSLVSYLNSVGRKGKNYKQAIALFVQAETAIKLERGQAIENKRTERSWQIASAAYDAIMRRRNNWKARISTFGGSGNDMAWVIARRAKGGFLVGGTLRRKIGKGKGKKANHVMGLVAFNRKGEKVWHRPLGSPGNDASIRSLRSLPDGGFLIGGIHAGFQVVARVDHNGILIKDHKDALWITGFSKSGDEASGVVVRAGDGNFIAIGAETITRKGISPRLPFAIRFSQDGKTLGKTLYSGDAALFMHNITDATVLAGGDVVAVGEAKARAAWDTRAGMGYLLRISPKGKLVWARRVAPQGKDGVGFTAVTGAHDGGIVAAGHEGSRLLIVKSGPDGAVRWRKILSLRSFVPKGGQELCAIPNLVVSVQTVQKRRKLKVSGDKHIATVRAFTCPTGAPFLSAAAVVPRDGGYLILAFQGWGKGEKTDLRLIAVDENGNVRWDKIYGHEGFDMATGAAVTEDGGFIVVGTTDSVGTGGRDFLLFKIDQLGELAPWKKLGPSQKVKPTPKRLIKPKAKAKAKPAPADKPKAEPKAPAKVSTVEPEGPAREATVEPEAPAREATVEPEAPAREAKKSVLPDEPGTSADEEGSASSETPGADENPPDTSFGSIFGSVFGSDDSEPPEGENN